MMTTLIASKPGILFYICFLLYEMIVDHNLHLVIFSFSDLLIFSGIGALHSMNKLITNSPYSHVGMVFRLPNKWTRRDDLFVLEVAKNAEGNYTSPVAIPSYCFNFFSQGFLDAFLERPYTGVALYRLLERLHQYQGTVRVVAEFLMTV